MDAEGVTVVFRLDDTGSGPSDSDWDCALCKISNNRTCQDEIPPGTPKEEVRKKLDECLAEKCKGCGGSAGGGVIVIA